MKNRAGRSVEELYASSGADLPFERLMREHGTDRDDDTLAELIEADGRARIAIGREVELKRYLDAVPGLESRPVPLDAAIDVSLRWLSSSSRPAPKAVQELEGKYPHLSSSIRAAASLGEAMWSTAGLRTKLRGPVREVPSDFGPRTAEGHKRYQLRRLLGSGGWGQVYLALDRQLSDVEHEALVAIKFLTGLNRDEWARQRFTDEASKARRVEHPHVVRVLDRGVTDEDEDYLVYEFVAGGDLSRWLGQQPRWPDARAAARLVAKVARGVQAAHSAGLVHCDLKPGNVLMGTDGEPRVTDFGIAVRQGERPERGERGSPVGNLAFISPEQHRSEEGSLSVASDIYALGGLLYYLVTRELPNGSSVEEIAQNHAREGGRAAPPRLAKRLRWLDRDLDRVCARAMAIAPSDRHASAGGLADDLETWLNREPVHWTRPGLGRRAAMWCRRSPVMASVLALTLVAAGVGAGAAVHWSNVAAVKSYQANESAERFAAGKRIMRQTYQLAMWGDREGPLNDALPAFVLWEWLNGPQIVTGSTVPELKKQWTERIEGVRAHLAALEKEGRGESFESVMWQTALGLFLLEDGEPQEAEPLLGMNKLRWSQALKSSDDPWLKSVEKLETVARVSRMKASVDAGVELNPSERTLLAADRDLLLPELKVASDFDQRAPIHRLSLRALADVCGPKMLNDADTYKIASKRVAALPKRANGRK